MAHALSNRVAALGGINGLADPGQIWTERLSNALRDEARRLEEILRLMRLLPDDGRGDPGAVELQPLVPEVIALHGYHSALLQVECAAIHDRETMPVFANRPRLAHALLLAIDVAKRHAHARGGRVTVSYEGDAETVTIRVATEPSATPAEGTAPCTRRWRRLAGSHRDHASRRDRPDRDRADSRCRGSGRSASRRAHRADAGRWSPRPGGCHDPADQLIHVTRPRPAAAPSRRAGGRALSSGSATRATR